MAKVSHILMMIFRPLFLCWGVGRLTAVDQAHLSPPVYIFGPRPPDRERACQKQELGATSVLWRWRREKRRVAARQAFGRGTPERWLDCCLRTCTEMMLRAPIRGATSRAI